MGQVTGAHELVLLRLVDRLEDELRLAGRLQMVVASLNDQQRLVQLPGRRRASQPSSMSRSVRTDSRRASAISRSRRIAAIHAGSSMSRS